MTRSLARVRPGISLARTPPDAAPPTDFRRCSAAQNKETDMRAVIVVGLLLAGSGGLSAAGDAKTTKGEQLYADQRCALCHSIGDKGNKKGPLDGVGTKLSADELRQWIVDAKGMTAKTKAPRKPEMKNYALAKDDVEALVAYMQTLKK
jgi:mono/diheme cytochrome c family protein